MGWFSVPKDFEADPEKRTKSGKSERAPWGELVCVECGRSLTKGGMGHCKCDPELKRPRRWYE